MSAASCCQSSLESWKIQNESIHSNLMPSDFAANTASWNVFASSETFTPSLKRWYECDVNLRVFEVPQQWLSVTYCGGASSSSEHSRNRNLLASGWSISRRRVGQYVMDLKPDAWQSVWVSVHLANHVLAHAILAAQSDAGGLCASEFLWSSVSNVSKQPLLMKRCAYHPQAHRWKRIHVCIRASWLQHALA